MASIEYQSKGKWRISQMYNGKRYRITVESDEKPKKKDARLLIEAEINKAIIDGEQKPKNQKLTVRAAGERYIKAKEKSLSPSTIRGYTTYLRNIPDFFADLMLDDVTEELLQQLAGLYQTEHSVKYAKNVIGFIKSVMKMFRKDFSFNISYAVEVKEEPYIPTSEEVKAIIQKASGTEFEIPIMLAAACGLRRGEILALTPEDLEDNNVLHINKAMAMEDGGKLVIKNCPKTKGSVRDVVVPPAIADLIRQKGYIYKGYPNSILKWLERAESQLNINKFSFHKLRHYYCTTLHENGIPDAIIMKLGGWSDPSVMTRIYRHGRNDFEIMNNAAAITASGLF